MSQEREELARFVWAQEYVDEWAGKPVYELAREEVRAGRKRSHWIWYIFPQIAGLGSSPEARRFGIAGLDEARAYLAHPKLRARLDEMCRALLEQPSRDPYAVMGSGIDALKLRSSMTLFAHAEGSPDSLYRRVLNEFYGGREDELTLRKLEERSEWKT